MIIRDLLYNLYQINNLRLGKSILNIIKQLEGGELYSSTLRRIFKNYHKVEIGIYSHGGCFIPGQIDKFTTIGRYCSIARTARVMNRNHPVEFKSTHAMFCISDFGLCDQDLVDYVPIEIENDVWIGHNAIIMPHVRKICTGAIIAAGAVVNKDIPPYAIVVGNPARVVRFRFSEQLIKELLASKWWNKSINEIRPFINEFQKPFEDVNLGNGKNLLQ